MTEVNRLLTAKDIQRIFSMGRNQAYALMHSQSFPSITINHRLFVSQKDLDKWLQTYVGRKYIF